MRRIAVTGANGFIGRSVVKACLQSGYEVITLARRPVDAGHWIQWTLGDPLPDACKPVDAVIHLASSTLVACADVDASVQLDISGTAKLAQSTRAKGYDGSPARFIFLSSQSATPYAKNRYGQSKYSIEQSLTNDNEIIVKPGLVFDDTGGSVFGLFEKLSRLPVLPVISSAANIQPINVDELAECLLRIVQAQTPEKTYCLGYPKPLTFAEAISATARRSGRRPPLPLRVPLMPVKAVAWTVDKLLHLSPSIGERIDGLVALRPMETASSLQKLGVSVEGITPAANGP
ncbi:NAD-dependent epimerase/dehydratase family protein [Paraburkholderia acidiphila]|uniref:NAD-dependent epimerase/dehydratase family protein n=1 Tax=Paraburkholderia acidiphila TaxID=2571747 RepID=A0A7Z2G2S6_9BURK|nr:NAD-dependent epimerase/dehydratase family protein [Paraburkholderia acidiphila]QGZ54029.1 NAD-dependent epimerase/dehydratase family protein [Paraburkholderia acidiphila]